MYHLILWICTMAVAVVYCQKYYDLNDYFETQVSWKCPNSKCENGDVHCCYLRNITFEADQEVTGSNLAYKSPNGFYYGPDSTTHNKLNKLVIDKSVVRHIPGGLFKTFSVLDLRISQSGLSRLNSSDFIGASRLVKLYLKHNEINVLSPNVFVHLSNIEVINLSNNRIRVVSKFSFDNLPRLRILILSNNFIETFDLNSNLLNLAIFMIGNNSLVNLNENMFKESKDLKELCVNDNKLKISNINVDHVLQVFDASNNPKPIYLASKFLNIQNSNFTNLTIDKTVTVIDASKNRIRSLVVDPENILLDLNLSHNNYTSMQNLTALKTIQSLDLSFNQIKDFSITSFSNMPDLTHLYLENCGLLFLDFGIFSQQSNLISLDLSYNNLQQINLKVLPNTLKVLHIEGNGLRDIDVHDIRVIMPMLSQLGLSNNKFSCEKLAEIRKLLVASYIQLIVDTTTIVKFSTNIDGIGCLSENSTETLEFQPNDLAPIHSIEHQNNISRITMQVIEDKIKEIEQNVISNNASYNENSNNSLNAIFSLKQEIGNIQNDLDLQLLTAKADILFSISNLFNVSKNDSVISRLLKSYDFEAYRFNLLRVNIMAITFRKLSEKVTNLEDGYHDTLSSMRGMMIFIVIALILLVIGFALMVRHKRFYFVRQRFTSTNTINTNLEQSSLV